MQVNADLLSSLSADLAGKVALVTGASRGIGEAIAHAYARNGAQVVLASRKQADLDTVAQAITEAGGQATAIAAHTGDSEAVDALIQQTLDTYGGLDIVVNNAATNPHFGPILTSDDSHWDKIFDVNVKGYFRLAKASHKPMKKRGGGSIINIASIAGEKPLPMMGVYSVSKAAVVMLTQALASELAGQGIRVNAVLPGLVKTKFSQALWANDQILKSTLKDIPQGRMAEPEEIAGLALYLASDAARFMTGASLRIDGGQLVSTAL